MNVKICGITRYEDARAALDAGAWALGFIFHKPSRRFIEPQEAMRIARKLPEAALTVGVFVDWPLDELNAIVREAGLGGAQLHGDESPEYAGSVNAGLVIKALRVEKAFDPARASGFRGCSILLDAYDPGRAGGTGKSFDWSLARRTGESQPVILAGGINESNVAEAIRQASPFAIDVSTGVEASPGIKDKDKIARLFQAIERST